MAMTIDVSILDGSTPADKLTAWLTYTNGDQSFDLLLRLASAEEQRARIKSHKGDDAFEAAEWWLAHVSDWRDLNGSDGQPIPFNPSLLRRLWDVDPYFSGWLMRESQRFANFRNPARAA